MESVPGFNEAASSELYSELRVPSPWPVLHGGQPAPSKGSIYLSIEKLFARIFSKLSIWSGFDPMILWALEVWRWIRTKTDVDLVLISGGPFSSFFPGYYLSRRLGCPLVLDYRDVWNNSPHTKFRISTRTVERRLLRHSKLVTAVSPSCLTSILGCEGRPSAVVTNGVSEQVYQYRCHHLQPSESLVVYAGALYPPKRSIEPFFDALVKFLEKRGGRNNIGFLYLGPSVDYVQEAARFYGLAEIVECKGIVSHEEALRTQAKALVTLVITTIEDEANEADRGILTGKLFEAIELARNVLVISPANSDARTLTAGMKHVRHFTGTQHAGMAQWLEELFNTPFVLEPPRPRYFAWEELGARFAKHLNGIGNT